MLSEKRQKELQKRQKDESIRAQLLVNMAKGIPTKRLRKYTLEGKDTDQPQKPILITNKDRVVMQVMFSCPNCEEVVIRIYDNFCPCCGRKLKWAKAVRGAN